LAELRAGAQRLIIALRIVIGGSVLSARVVRHFQVSLLDPPTEETDKLAYLNNLLVNPG
jgi:hypothetical protein